MRYLQEGRAVHYRNGRPRTNGCVWMPRPISIATLRARGPCTSSGPPSRLRGLRPTASRADELIGQEGALSSAPPRDRDSSLPGQNRPAIVAGLAIKNSVFLASKIAPKLFRPLEVKFGSTPRKTGSRRLGIGFNLQVRRGPIGEVNS